MIIINNQKNCPYCNGTLFVNDKYQIECSTCDMKQNGRTGDFYIHKSLADVHEIFN